MNTEQQLREVLGSYAERSGDNSARTAQVGRRVLRRRRRRAALAGSLSLLVLAGAIAVPVLAHRGGSSQQLRELTPHPASRAFPEYADGGRLLAGGRLTTTAGPSSTTYTFTPTSYLLQLNVACTGPSTDGAPDNFSTHLAVDGQAADTFTGGCTAYQSGDLSDVELSRQRWGHLDRLGQPNTVTVTLTSGPEGQGVPAGVDVTTATYQSVPFAAYPLPPRPAAIVPITPDSDGKVVLDAQTVGANGTHTLTLTAGNESVLDLYTDGPGLLDVAVDGHHVTTSGSYDWYEDDDSVASLVPGDLAAEGVHVRQGQEVTVTVAASHLAGPDWLGTYSHL